MTNQTIRFIVIVAIQLIILGVIIFFPESKKSDLFSEYEEVSRPDITMRLSDDVAVDDTVRAIDEAGLFERYRWSRAVGVETPEQALLVLPDYNFTQYWHFEAFLVAAHDAGLGALILDMKDVPEFVPLKADDGTLRSTDERMQIFADAARQWLTGLGFSKVALVSFGTGVQSALNILERSPAGAFTSWVDVSGMASGERWTLALSSETLWPTLFFVTGAADRHLTDRKKIAHELSSRGVSVTHRIVPSTGSMLLNEEEKLDAELEEEIIDQIFRWTK